MDVNVYYIAAVLFLPIGAVSTFPTGANVALFLLLFLICDSFVSEINPSCPNHFS